MRIFQISMPAIFAMTACWSMPATLFSQETDFAEKVLRNWEARTGETTSIRINWSSYFSVAKDSLPPDPKSFSAVRSPAIEFDSMQTWITDFDHLQRFEFSGKKWDYTTSSFRDVRKVRIRGVEETAVSERFSDTSESNHASFRNRPITFLSRETLPVVIFYKPFSPQLAGCFGGVTSLEQLTASEDLEMIEGRQCRRMNKESLSIWVDVNDLLPVRVAFPNTRITYEIDAESMAPRLSGWRLEEHLQNGVPTRTEIANVLISQFDETIWDHDLALPEFATKTADE